MVLSTQRARRSGNVVVLVGVSLVGVFGVAGLVVDGGRVMAERRQLQNAADAAALAAAIDLYNGASANQARDTAMLYVGRNGFDHNNATVDIPPTSGGHANDSAYAEVNLDVEVPTTFMSVIWSSPVRVRVRAVAGKDRAPASGTGLLVLNGAADGALSMSGSASLKVANGALTVNSSNGQAVKTSGSPVLEAPTIDIVGGYSTSTGTQLIGPVRTGVSSEPDPLASVAAPDPASLTVMSNSRLTLVGGSHVLQPGRYIGGVSISSGANVQLQPGIYYIDDGDFTTSSSTLTGDEVMIYAERRLTLSGSSPIRLSPPKGGDYQGISIFQDRSGVYPVVLSGGSNMNLTGTIYAPRARITLSGTSGIGSFGSQIIGDTVSMSGLASLQLNWSTAVAHKSGVYLVE